MNTKAYYCPVNNRWRFMGLLGAIFAIIAIFFVIPILEKNFFTHLLLQCNFTLLILSTIFMVEAQKTILFSGLVFLVPFIFFDSLSFQSHSMFDVVMAHGFYSVFTIVSIVVLMRKILYSRLINVDLIFGALMVYLLSGILWANFYFMEDITCPGCFHGIGILDFNSTSFHMIYEQQFNFLYYSFATLATLGMGDITPLSHLAKSLTALEAMFGQLFVAIIIAKLVSVWWHVPAK